MSDRPTVAVAVAPFAPEVVTDAVVAGGGTVGPLSDADALVWLDPADMDGLAAALGSGPGIRWVQLPFAGIEHAADAGLLGPDRVWTSAKGIYGPLTAEHALLLALAGLRRLPERARARTWGEQGATSLLGADVTIVGGGGITRALLDLLAPFGARATVVRRQAEPVAGAARTVTVDRLDEVLPGARVVFVALALTPATRGIIGATQLAAMDPTAWLVNVARGAHVDTDALVAALRDRAIGGAALDVTDPEPLPDGHPLWSLDNCLITPHTANPFETAVPLLAVRVGTNVGHFAAGRELEGLVDPTAGY